MAQRRRADAEDVREVPVEPYEPLKNWHVDDSKCFTRELQKFEKALDEGKVMKAMMICDKFLEKNETFLREEPFAAMATRLYERLRHVRRYENLIFQQFAALHCSDTLLFYLQDHFRHRPFHTMFTLGKTFLSDTRRRHLALTIQAEPRTFVFGVNASHCLGFPDSEMDYFLEAPNELPLPPTYHCHTSGRHTIWWAHNKQFYGCGFSRNFMITKLKMGYLMKPYRLDIKFAVNETPTGYMTFPAGTLFQTTQRWHFIGNITEAKKDLDKIVGCPFYNAFPQDQFSNYWKCESKPSGNIMKFPPFDDSRNLFPLFFRGNYLMIRVLPTYWTECNPIIGGKRRPIIFLLDGVEVNNIKIDNMISGFIWVVHKHLLYEGFLKLMMKADNDGNDANLDNYFLMIELMEQRTPSPYQIKSVTSFDQTVIVSAGNYPCHLFDHLKWREEYFRGHYVHNYMYECVKNFMDHNPIQEMEYIPIMNLDEEEEEQEDVDGDEGEDEEEYTDAEEEFAEKEFSDVEQNEGPEALKMPDAPPRKDSEVPEEYDDDNDSDQSPKSPKIYDENLEAVPSIDGLLEVFEDCPEAQPETPNTPGAPEPSGSSVKPSVACVASGSTQDPKPLEKEKEKTPEPPVESALPVVLPAFERHRVVDIFAEPNTIADKFEQNNPPPSEPTSAETSPDRSILTYDKTTMKRRMKIMVEAVLCEARQFTSCPDFRRPLEADECGRLATDCRYANYFSFLAYISTHRLPNRPMKFMDTDMDRFIITNNPKLLADNRMKLLYQEFERVNYPGIDVWKPVDFLKTRPAPEVDPLDENNYRTMAMFWALNRFITQLRLAWRLHEYEWNTPLNLHLFSIILGTLRCAGSLIRLRLNSKLYRELPVDEPVFQFLQNHVKSIPDNELLFQTANPGAILKSRIAEGFLTPDDIGMRFGTLVKFRMKHEDPNLDDSVFELTTSMDFLNCQNTTILPYINDENVLDLNEVYKDCQGLDRLIVQTHFMQNGVTDLEHARKYHERRLRRLGWKFFYMQRYFVRGEQHILGYLIPRFRGGALVDLDPKTYKFPYEELQSSDGPPVCCHRDLTRLFSMSTNELPTLTRRLLVKAMRGLYDRNEFTFMRIDDRVQILDWYFSASMPEAFNDLLKQIIIEAKSKDAKFIRYIVDCYTVRARRLIAQYRPGILMWNKVPVPNDGRIRHVKVITEMWPKNEWNRPRRVPPKDLIKVNGTTEPSKFWKIDSRDLHNWFLDGKVGISRMYLKQFQQDFPFGNTCEQEKPEAHESDDEEEVDSDEPFVDFNAQLFNLEKMKRELVEQVEGPRCSRDKLVDKISLEWMSPSFTESCDDGNSHWMDELDRQANELMARLKEQE